MPAERAVRGLEEKNRLTCFLRHGHQALVVPETCKAMGIIINVVNKRPFIVQNMSSVHLRYARGPACVGAGRAPHPFSVLEHDITDRLHVASRCGNHAIWIAG